MAASNTTTRLGAAVACISVLFSLLCFAITAVFTAAVILAALFGLTSAALALALQARRTAWVAVAFAMAPLGEFLLIEYVAERVGSAYVAFAALIPGLIVLAWALIDYARSRRNSTDSAARPVERVE